MPSIEIKPVRTPSERRAFLQLPWKVYADDPLWVPPLLPDQMRKTDPARGSFYSHAEIEMFSAWRDGEMVGSILVGEDEQLNNTQQKRRCLVGYWEYIEDYEVFKALVDVALEWARNRKLASIWGPFNLDYEDGYGILVEGRDRPPALMCGHTPEYYQEFVERRGFRPARPDNLAFAMAAGESPAFDRMARLASRLIERGRITIRGVRMEEFDTEVDRIHRLLIAALAHLGHSLPWPRERVERTVAQFKRIADPELVLFAEVDGEAVGWMPGVPNLAEHFAKVDGLRHPWDYVKLLWLMRQKTECLAIKSLLVDPRYWNRGVAVMLFHEMFKRGMARGYKWADLSLTSADNPQTPIIAEHMGAKLYKRYRIYELPTGVPDQSSDAPQ